jgi:farnesyl diphosphate synthase
MGQALDLHLASKDVFACTMEEYLIQIKYKTSLYTFYLPLMCGMIVRFAPLPVPAQLEEDVMFVSIELGELFQYQDDFLDCYGEKTSGKKGTDIQDRKCTWLFLYSLQHASEAQRQELSECYGRNEPDKVLIVKRIYDNLKVPEAYAEYESLKIANVKRKISKSHPSIRDSARKALLLLAGRRK